MQTRDETKAKKSYVKPCLEKLGILRKITGFCSMPVYH